jgi:hypothetical protein
MWGREDDDRERETRPMMTEAEAKAKMMYVLFDQPFDLVIESRNGLIDQADEEYRLVSDGDGGTVVMDWGKAFSAYAEAYEEIARSPISEAGRDVTVVGRDFVERWLRSKVGTDDLAGYLTADSGWVLGVDVDGTVHIGDSVGREIEPSERPIATAKCPGLGNLDMAWWREGWDCEALDDDDVVRDCCENGDVSDELDGLIARLLEDVSEEGMARLKDYLTGR